MIATSNSSSNNPWRMSRGKAIALGVLTVLIVVPAAYGFGKRFLEFFHTLQQDKDGSFTIVPMLNYLAVAAGFICLFVWAVFRGMFHDIERPKFTMLENEEKLDRGETIDKEQSTHG